MSSGGDDSPRSSSSYILGVKVHKNRKRRTNSALLVRAASLRMPLTIHTPSISSRGNSDVMKEERDFLEKNWLQKLIYLFSFWHSPSYRFLYSSWEIVKAVRLGRTKSKLDFVVYRFVCPMIILGFYLFWLSKMRLISPYVFIETWISLIELIYSLAFLGHVLIKNRQTVLNSASMHVILREYTRTMYRTPNGHSRIVEQKSVILNKEPIGKTEKLIWFLLNLFASVQLAIFVAHFASWLVHYISERHTLNIAADCNTAVGGIMTLVDLMCIGIFIVPPHIIYPIIFLNIYFLFTRGEDQVYQQLNWKNRKEALIFMLKANGLVVFCHLFLCLMVYIREKKIKEYSLETNRRRRYKTLIQSRLRARTVYGDTKSVAPRFGRLGDFGTERIEEWRMGRRPSNENDEDYETEEEMEDIDISDQVNGKKVRRRRPLPYADIIAKHKDYRPELESMLYLYRKGFKGGSKINSKVSKAHSKNTMASKGTRPESPILQDESEMPPP